MKYQITDINYCVSEEDAGDDTVEKIKESLPKTLIVEVDDEDEIVDAISDQTGWLVEHFDYKPLLI